MTNKIISLYEGPYQDYNFNHFKDMLERNEGITISYTALYKLLTSHGHISCKAQRITRKRALKEQYLKEHPKEEISEKQLEEVVDHQLAIEDAHPRKGRCKYFGEEIQTDGSIHNWFGETKSCLHLSIDNCTGIITGGYFDYQETLNGYYHVFKQILSNYGIPFGFKTDKRTVFTYASLARKDDEKDTLTQFGYVCKILGVGLKTTSVSQAKGMIERANGTFQGRLVNELKSKDITDIDEANRYLTEVFIPEFNKRFATNPNEVESVFEKAPNEEEINLLLSVRSPRKIDSGCAVKYKNKYYQPYDKDDKLVCFPNKTECLVTRTFDGRLYLSVDNGIYILKELEKRKEVSVNFDVEVKEEKKKHYIPPMNHPWRRSLFVQYQKNVHRTNNYNL